MNGRSEVDDWPILYSASDVARLRADARRDALREAADALAAAARGVTTSWQWRAVTWLHHRARTEYAGADTRAYPPVPHRLACTGDGCEHPDHPKAEA